jgi:hypothetical protein
MKSIHRRFLVFLISGPIIALAFHTPFVVSDLRTYLSRMQVFRQITLDMSREQTMEILLRGGIICSTSEGATGGADRVVFNDFWWQYIVYFHPETHRVARKVLMFQKRESPIQRLTGRAE